MLARGTPSVDTRLVALCLLPLLFSQARAAKGEPPRLDEEAQTKFRVPVGTKQFKLVCPVHPDDKDRTMVHWSRNGETIDWEYEYKMAKENRELRMKNVKAEDSGKFTCTAVNGFGHRSIDFIVQVFNPATDVLSTRDRISLSNQTSPPEWIDDTDMVTTTSVPVRVNLGGKLELRCPARGNPLPDIKWFKNDERLPQASQQLDSALLTVESAKIGDKGDYRCEVTNKYGIKQASFKVLVADFFDASAEDAAGLAEDGFAPLIQLPYNISVPVGHTAQFLCKARASHRPVIKWLKQISDPSKADGNATIVHANGMHLVLVDQNVQQLSSEHSDSSHNFLTNRLVIPHAAAENAGKYICVVTSPAGHIVYRAAHLEVTRGIMIGNVSLSENVFWIVAIPLLSISIVLVTCAICWLRTNSTEGSDANGNSAKNHPPPPRIPPPPAPADVIYPQIPQIGQVQQQHHLMGGDAPRSPLILRDSMFQPARHATLDRIHTPHRLHRGYREDEMNYPSTAGMPSPHYWTQPKQLSFHQMVPPPPTVMSGASGNYRTLDMAYGRDPLPSVYSSDYAEHMPFLPGQHLSRDL